MSPRKGKKQHVNITISIPWLTRKRLMGIVLPLTVIPVVLLTAAFSCGGGTAPAATANNVNSGILGHYNTVQPPLEPTGDSVYRDTLTFAEATHILGLNTYSFFMRKGGTGAPIYQCQSAGSAVPDTAELTNPQQYVTNADDPSMPSDGVAVIGNMDPDGVFPPSSSAGTYVRCLYDNGKPYLVYSEPDVLQINASSASWDPSLYGGQGGIVVPNAAIDGQPICQVRTIQVPANGAGQASGGGSGSTVSAQVTNCKAAPGTVSGKS